MKMGCLGRGQARFKQLEPVAEEAIGHVEAPIVAPIEGTDAVLPDAQHAAARVDAGVVGCQSMLDENLETANASPPESLQPRVAVDRALPQPVVLAERAMRTT